MTTRLFLESWNLLSPEKLSSGSTSYYAPMISAKLYPTLLQLVEKKRLSEKCSIKTGLKEESFSKALSFANKNNIDKVIILGDDEFTSGIYKIKSMDSGLEESFSLAD